MKITTLPLINQYQNITGEEEGITIEVRQAREGEQIQWQQLFAKTTRVFDSPALGEVGMGDSVRLEVEQNRDKVRRAEAYLVLASVSGVTDENDKELFRTKETVDGKAIRFAMTEEQFNTVWNRLPPRVTKVISEMVWDTNPQWHPEYSGE